MKKTLIIFFLFIIQKTNAQNIFICHGGEVGFYSKGIIEDIDATSYGMNSVLNTSTNEIVFVVPMTSFKFKKGLMQEHFNEKYVESDKYPNATYKGKIIDTIDYKKDGEFEIISTGLLTMHGVEKQRTEKGKLIIKNGEIKINSEFPLAIKDHNISIPKLLNENIADTIKVNFSAKYSLFKKDK